MSVGELTSRPTHAAKSRFLTTMKYFTIEELTRSATAIRRGIDNTPDITIKANLKALVENILDPLRSAWGRPIIVTSGYRCPLLNRAVGGATNSAHLYGYAADIRTVTDTRADNARLLRLLLNLGLPYDQVINEYPDAQGRPDWIHVSYKRVGTNRGNELTAQRVNGRTIYSKGITL